MNQDCLKLTTYFGERDRDDGRFVADTLLDLYGRREAQVSVLLRGATGFGIRHHVRTDRLLTLSEDLPLVSIAVDTRARIEAMLDEVMAIKRRGLVTLERARMLTGDIRPVTLPEELHEATKLTVYAGRQERVYGMPAHVAICDLLYRREIAGASVLLGVDGTSHGERRRARMFGRNADVPLMIIAVGEGRRIGRLLAPSRRGSAASRSTRRSSAGCARAARAGSRRCAGLGVPRRPRAARRQVLPAAPSCPGRHDRHRPSRRDRAVLRGRRRAHASAVW